MATIAKLEVIGGRCETCKWWERHSADDLYGACLVVPVLALYPDEYDDDDDRKPDNPLAFIMDDIDENGLITRHDFGCVQWGPKEAG